MTSQLTGESKNDHANDALGLGSGLSCADIDFPLGSKLSTQLRSLLYVLCGHSLPRRYRITRGRMGREKGATFTPFLVLRLLTVSVTILQRRLEWKYRQIIQSPGGGYCQIWAI